MFIMKVFTLLERRAVIISFQDLRSTPRESSLIIIELERVIISMRSSKSSCDRVNR